MEIAFDIQILYVYFLEGFSQMCARAHADIYQQILHCLQKKKKNIYLDNLTGKFIKSLKY